MSDRSTARVDGHPEEQTPRGSLHERSQLRGGLGTTAVVFSVMSYLAPLAAAGGFLTLIIGYGNGLGAPVTFLACGVLFWLFSYGFLAMVRQVKRPGAYYAYITAALGKRIGLGAGMLSVVFYLMVGISFFVFCGLESQSLMQQYWDVDLPWWTYSLVFLAITLLCAYRALDFNVRILGVIVAVEIALLVVFDVATMVRGGHSGLSLTPFTWESVSSGSFAVAMLFAIGILGGFESTAVYREEVRDPTRTIPRATKAVVVIVTIFSCWTTYCIIMALGTENAVQMTYDNPNGTFRIAATATVGEAYGVLLTFALMISILACLLAFAAIGTRYLYSLGTDGVLPRALGTVHPRLGSPSRAAVAANGIFLLGILTVALSGLDPQETYAVIGGASMFGSEVMIVLVATSVIVYFRRHKDTGESAWSTLITPIISLIGFGSLLVYSALNAEIMLGEPNLIIPVVFAIFGAAFFGGIVYASWLATRKPDVFAGLGRMNL